ncbi:MAG: GldG family protein [Patescibacteria group bacterium]|nr:GldG family protein [Patescibacteria group bacterium]
MIIEKLKKIRQTKLWATTINVVLTVIAINLILNFFPIGIDLTAEKVHSLTPETKEILSGLNDIVNVKAFVSGNLPPQLITQKKVLENVLSQYKNLSGGKIRVTWLDPEKDETVAREALSLGIAPIQFSSIQKDQLQLVNSYFGLVISYAGKSAPIAVLEEINNLEYQLTSEIKKIQSGEPVKIGISSGLGETERSSLQGIIKFLSSNYRMANIDLSVNSDFEDPGIKTLILVGPTDKFSSEAKLFLDQLLMDQKGVLLLLNRVYVDGNLIASKTDNDLDGLLDHYGIKINNDLVIDASSGFATFRTQTGNFVVPYPFWVKTRAENRASDLPPTASLESSIFPWVSSISIDKGARALWRSSIRSKTSSQITNVSPDQDWGFEELENENPPVLAAIQTSGFDSYFSQEPTPEKIDLAGKEIKKHSDSIKLAVVADANFVEDQTAASNPENIQFLLNLVDYLCQDTRLINIRSKTVFSRPLRPLDENQKQIIKTISLGAGPVLLLISGLSVRWRRKKSNKVKQDDLS